jgi:hypothetical protein
MSPANGRPLPPPAPSTKAQQDDPSDRSATGVRPRAPSSPVISSPQITHGVETEVPLPLAEGIRNNSIAPESLKKPYASLAPPKKQAGRSTTSPRRSDTEPRAPLSSDPGWEDASSLTDAGQAPEGTGISPLKSSSPASSGPTSSSKLARAICKKHKIARGAGGVCLMCRKEESEKPKSGSGWIVAVSLMALAVIGGAIVAILLRFR